jgi:ribosome-associated toxin RatA of RatAB toxin-antitoxin module
MSEFKGQLLGMLLVVAVFGAISTVLVQAFTTSANQVASQVVVDSNGKVVAAPAQP